jgi:hypothetical protein
LGSQWGAYPASVKWASVSKQDQNLFKSVRERLKKLAESLVASGTAPLPLKAETSHPTPNGRSATEIWCCVYPDSVPNKSYGLQIALIISNRGAEVCFCQGSGTSQVGDLAKKNQFAKALDKARENLKKVPQEIIKSVEAAQKRKWFYRKSWLQKPNEGEFTSLAEWLHYASTPDGSSASVSAFFSPAELQDLGLQVFNVFSEALDTFSPILIRVYGGAPNGSDPTNRATVLRKLETMTAPKVPTEKILPQAETAIKDTGFLSAPGQIRRFVSALASKPFIILTGNSGTGKTKLAELFAQWLCGAEPSRFALVPVGADWTDNLGLNDGPAAGQTMPQLHFHVIPRYTGDVPDPRGGIRHIIPSKARYWQ